MKLAYFAYFASLATAQECISRWGDVAVPPADPVLGIKAQFVADDTPTKIGLSVGAYRDDDGNPWVLPPVEAARERLFGPNGTTTHEYLSIDGFERYNKLAQGLLYGPEEANHDVVNRGAAVGVVEFVGGPRGGAGGGSVVLLHLCAHNPSGVDPSRDQWKELAALVKRKGLFPLFDSAYLGFATGDLDADAWPFRYFLQQGLAPWACVSFSKNFGLYSERTGAVHATVASPHEADAVRGHLKKVARAMYSNPPAFGARVMSSRIGDMRTALRAKLDSLDTGRDWSHITSQIGMFSYTGMTKSEVLKIREKHHVYVLESGRISMAGINTKNVDQLATAIADVLE
ncbi:hypothetical protein JL721_3918 [Aureococcus anophagefferens]|nr:hypothetical protein JL721_3918 [Aureococcus anophagefferens]